MRLRLAGAITGLAGDEGMPEVRGDLSDGETMRDIDEIAEWIVTGENRKAYEALREKYGLPPWEIAERHVRERHTQTWPATVDADAIDQRHRAIITKVKEEQAMAMSRRGMMGYGQ